jgi:hypothetical protein
MWRTRLGSFNNKVVEIPLGFTTLVPLQERHQSDKTQRNFHDLIKTSQTGSPHSNAVQERKNPRDQIVKYRFSPIPHRSTLP